MDYIQQVETCFIEFCFYKRINLYTIATWYLFWALILKFMKQSYINFKEICFCII
jgi:hypothetical protein